MAKRARIWIVLHREVQLTMESWVVDEDVFLAASSEKSALSLIRSSWVEPGTWWRVECAGLDDIGGTRADDRIPSAYSSRTAKRIDTSPRAQGYRSAILRDRRDVRMTEARLRNATREPLSAKGIRNLRASVRSVRAVLATHPCPGAPGP